MAQRVRRYLLLAGAGALLLALLWFLFLRGPRIEPLSDDQIKAEIASLAAVTVEFTSAPVLEIDEPAHLLGLTVPFSSEEVRLPLRAAVRAGFSPQALEPVQFRVDGSHIFLRLPSPEVLTVRAEPDPSSLTARPLPPELLARLASTAEASVRQAALEQGLLIQVQTNAAQQLSHRFQRFGYEVEVSFQAATPAPAP